MECRLTCGKCHRGEQCHHLTGHCPFGCDPGMFGEKCVNGNIELIFILHLCLSDIKL